MKDDDMTLDGTGSLSRRRRLFRKRKIPVRMLVPNFFTLLSLCAGVTAIRMAIEGRYDMAVALVVIAGLLDGVDGRLARALKAQSRFGAELDSLADFVNFGVAPAVVVFTWGLAPMKSLGWIAVLVFACAMSLRLARFNAMLDVDKPRWQSNFFTGMPAPAGAITVLLPIYITEVGLLDMRALPGVIIVYTFVLAALLVSTIPTYSGKLAGERIPREWAPAILVAIAALVGLLVTYPYATLTVVTLAYLAIIPVSFRRFHTKLRQDAAAATAGQPTPPAAYPAPAVTPPSDTTGVPPTKH